jgi:hypothetical protein
MSSTFGPIRGLLAAAAVTAALAAPAVHAATFIVDVAGAQSIDLPGEAGNTVLTVDVGAHGLLTGVSWSVTLDALAPSTRHEMQVAFGPGSGLDMLAFAPGEGDAFSGAASYSGSIDLAGLGLSVDADGVLRIEFSETYKDFGPGVVEGRWLSGTLTFDVSPVPEPATPALWLLGLGALGVKARRCAAGRPRSRSS